ncbi:MAG: YdiU family protein [Schleiferiaceae bacterium]|nr:YdiU family protein [Schleiferiaceae bacterium]
MITFDTPTYLTLPGHFYTEQHPTPISDPKCLLWNTALAKDLGWSALSDSAITALFSGNSIPEGLRPFAQAYAGHQFGHFTKLGDGRAVLLGEQLLQNGNRVDIQLKGAGPTPYSRRGDGRATLASMLREYLISEAMHHLGIPTSRSLAVIQTNDPVYREVVHPGAVLTRVMSSHIRVGTFEYARNFGQASDLEALLKYTIKRHYPELIGTQNPALAFLEHVMDAQIALIVEWMRVGFIHGVMNTDNMSIAGETFDYGPCAFMNSYHPDTVFSSIDAQGRYAFANQPLLARWNVAALAMALLPLLGKSETAASNSAKTLLDDFMPRYQNKFLDMMCNKLGIAKPQENDRMLVEELLGWMEQAQADYTNTFLVLSGDLAPDTIWLQPTFLDWKRRWEMRCGTSGPDLAIMRANNPKVIPRNHLVENALEQAHLGDLSPFLALHDILKNPYTYQGEMAPYQVPPATDDREYQTFCGT